MASKKLVEKVNEVFYKYDCEDVGDCVLVEGVDRKQVSHKFEELLAHNIAVICVMPHKPTKTLWLWFSEFEEREVTSTENRFKSK